MGRIHRPTPAVKSAATEGLLAGRSQRRLEVRHAHVGVQLAGAARGPRVDVVDVHARPAELGRHLAEGPWRVGEGDRQHLLLGELPAVGGEYLARRRRLVDDYPDRSTAAVGGAHEGDDVCLLGAQRAGDVTQHPRLVGDPKRQLPGLWHGFPPRPETGPSSAVSLGMFRRPEEVVVPRWSDSPDPKNQTWR